MSRDPIDFLVLDAVADDIESLPDIRNRVGTIPGSGSLLQVLQRLIRDQLIEACTIVGKNPELTPAGEGAWPQVNIEDMWFRITAHGRMVHSAWASDEAGTA